MTHTPGTLGRPAVLRPGSSLLPSLTRGVHIATLPLFLSVFAYATVAQGGFYRSQAMLIAAVLSALGMACVPDARALVPWGLGCGLLAAGLLVSGVSAGFGPNAPLAAAGLATATGTLAVARRLIARGERERVLEAVAVLGAGVAAAGIVGVLTHAEPWAIRAQGLWRASSTLTYANAAAAFLVLALGASALLLLDRATTARRLSAFAILCGLGATLSRGAIVAMLAAAFALLVMRSGWVVRPLARPALGAACALAALVPSIAGAQPRPTIGLAGVCVGVVIAVRGRAGRWLPVAAGVGVLVVALLAAPSVGRVLERRALPVSETRLSTWRATLSDALARPLTGAGPGTFAIVEGGPDGPVLTRFVHNEYLQVFHETGAVGLASVVGAIAIFAAWARRARRVEPAWAIAVAMCAAFAAHSAFDFVWRMPVLVGLAFWWLAVAATPEDGGTT